MENFAPVARLSTVRLIAALAVRHLMSIRQYDVTTAYLNGELQEEILMKPPKRLREILEFIGRTEEDPRNQSESMLLDLSRGDMVCSL